ncbi:peptidase family C78-domain-containing protein [Irpex rosettiformis]|uniref:Peptidase family C78-domain-containing protein n=1 Tax=Irpex rosettiformis TaxID=378272 RepID=A0ACB8UHU9_9APHY|nr:peptidase family C78-domain-containing protein [Irpex rosettiformis]
MATTLRLDHDGDDDDDDIQFLYQSNDAIECPACHRNLSHLTTEQRNAHCNDHFIEPQAGPSTTLQPNGHKTGKTRQMFKPRSFSSKSSNTLKEDRDIFWCASYDISPPPNFTPGLIPLIKKSLIKSHSKGTTQKAYLCSPTAVHVESEGWDKGWGCGYRNYLMASAALMDQERQPRYSTLLDSPSPPGVRRLQALIEEAWKEGYDEEGANQLKHKLSGTSKWIGTAELYVAFTYRGIPARLVDFELHKQGPELLVNWIIAYFSQGEATTRHGNINQALLGASSVVVTDKPPIVLQHSGHSRTIIGFERKKDGSINLLVFDPSRRILSWIRQLAISKHPSQAPPRQAQSSRGPSKHKLSPSKLADKVFHPQHGVRKRNGSYASIKNTSITSAKRVRAGDEPIVISDDELEPAGVRADASKCVRAYPSEVDWNKLAEVFRVKARSLEKKDKYQVLYFPMTEPLATLERQSHKTVTSQRIPPPV